MSEEQKHTLPEAQRLFAIGTNNQTWQLLEKPDRTKEEDELMVYAAHTAVYHWLQAGTEVNHQRGEYMIARAYVALGLTDEALRHAKRCLALTEQHRSLMEDFDLAYANEGMARALALSEKLDESKRYVQLADEAGRAISGEKDKEIFDKDFTGGDWYGVELPGRSTAGKS